MNDTEIITLFRALEVPYPRAASGLIEDLCLDLGQTLQESPADRTRIDRLTDLIEQCFRPMDAGWPRDSCPWDTAYYTFGRWLWRQRPESVNAVVAITSWDDDRISECRADYTAFVRYTRDDWIRVAEGFDTPDCG